MTEPERTVAGLRCSEVLARLSEFRDAELPPELRARIQTHLDACDWCLRFSENFLALLAEFHRQLAMPAPLEPTVHHRLHERLRRSLGHTPS